MTRLWAAITPCRFWTVFRTATAIAAVSFGGRVAIGAQSAEPIATKPFDIRADAADKSLKQFSIQSGLEIAFGTATTRQVRTNAVKGNYTPREAIDRLLAGTGLIADADEKSGALTISRDPNAQRAAPTASDRPIKKPNGNGDAKQVASDDSAKIEELDPFVVNTSKDAGYRTSATISGTRTGELLRNLPLAISVLNQELLRDIAVTDSAEAMALYGTGSESPGTPGLGVAAGGGGGNTMTFRGIASDWNSRDGFVWYSVGDNFSAETLELTRGPSGNVYGDGRAGGIFNVVSKRARSYNFGEIGLRWDSEGSCRGTLDWNRRLTPAFSARLNLMYQDRRDWRENVLDQREGALISLAYEFSRQTRISVVGEYNNVNRVPSNGQPADFFSSGYVLGTGTVQPGPAPIGTVTIQGAGATQRWTRIGEKAYNLVSTPGTVFRQTNVALPFGAGEGVIARDQQWQGPSDTRDNKASVVTVAFEHAFGPHTSVQGGYNLTLHERFENQANLDSIRRDVNPFLPGPGGTLVANPDFDQLYVEHARTQTQWGNRSAGYRLTGVQDLDFRLTRQRLILNGMLRDDRFRQYQRQELLTPEAIAAAGLIGQAALQTNNRYRRRYYLRDGHGDVLEHRGVPDAALYDVGGQKTRAQLFSASALALGSYWKDRVRTAVGIRRDNFEQRQVPYDSIPGTSNGATGLGRLRQGGSGEEVWREQLGQYKTAINYGVVLSPQETWRVFYNYAENFVQAGTAPYFNGDSRRPRVGNGYDYGFSVYPWKDRVAVTVTRFINRSQNESVVAINNQTIADEINTLLGTGYSTAFNGDTVSRKATGTELELTANPTPSWRATFKYAMRKNANAEFAPRLTATLTAIKARTADPGQYQLTAARLDALHAENPSARASWNYATGYNFTQGPLRGARAGLYGYFRQGQTVFVTNRPPLHFKSYIMTNAFAGYKVKSGGNTRSDFQLNVENLTNEQPRIGSGYTGYSYVAPIKFILQNTLRF